MEGLPDNSMRPPIRRSYLRLRLGKCWYTWKRRLLWLSPRFHFARTRSAERFANIQFSHATPLLRELQGVDMQCQINKIFNLKLAAARLNGVILRPGEMFSFWRLVGKPSRRKGYLDGLVLFMGQIGTDVGGGLCQMTNLIFWMTLHTPLTVVERYRHSHDVFPDANRVLPFGSGATCAYPHRDLMIRNDTQHAFQLCIRVGETKLEGEWRAECPAGVRYEIVEKNHRMERGPWGGYIRHNELFRRTFGLDGALLDESFLLANDAMMMYDPLLAETSLSPQG